MKLIELILNFIKRPYIFGTLIVIIAIYFGYLTAGELKAWINELITKVDVSIDL